MDFLKLFGAFFRIGLFTFGGGYAMLPMLERECVDKYGWCTKEELLDMFAIGQCTPGVIAVNTATFIGRKNKGILGALCSTLGVITPSLIIITIIAAVLQNFADIPAVQHAMAGIRIAVAALILSISIKLIKSSWKKPVDIIIGIIAFLVVGLLDFSPAVVVIAAGLYGVFAVYFARRREPVAKEDDKNE